MRSTRWRRRAAMLVAGMVLGPLPGLPAHAADPLAPVLGDPGTTLPNLVPDVRHVEFFQQTTTDLVTGTSVPVGPPRFLFDTWVQNLGAVSLQLTAEDLADFEDTPVSQCVSWRTDRLCREQRPVGGFGLDPDHGHFHFEEFAAYELRRLLHNGRVDYSNRGLVASNGKVSFCMIDSAQVRDDAFPVGYYRGCGTAMQGVSAGWADIYSAGLPGQEFPVESLVDGRYALVVDLDYANRLYETDDTDNVVEVTVEISGNVTQVAIVGRNRPERSTVGGGDDRLGTGRFSYHD